MIEYGLFRFASAPLSGGDWLERAMEGIVPAAPGYFTVEFKESKSSSLKVSVIRHPLDWLVSFWIAANNGMSLDYAPSEMIQSANDCALDLFLIEYVNQMSGFVGDLFMRYKADAFLRIEDMPDALIELLSMVGVSASLAKRCRGLIRPIRPSGAFEIEPITRSRVMDSERSYVEAYDYV